MNKPFESKFFLMGELGGLAKSIVMLSRRMCTSGRKLRIMYQPDTRHCERVVDALPLSQAKTVRTPVVKDTDRHAQLGEENCSWESMQMDSAKQWPSGEQLSEEETWVHSSTAARLSCWAVSRLDMR